MIVILEVTEHDAHERTDAMLAPLRLACFGLSIDDFDTGVSGLDQLKSVPFTELKLDRAFIDGIADHRVKQTITRASMAMAHETGMSVVAEGGETVADWQYLEPQGATIFRTS